jgi:hypothetical protein
LLLVEAKAILAIDSFHEQVESSAVLTGAQEQLRRAEAVLAEMPIASKQKVFPFVAWESVAAIHKLILTPDSPPGSMFSAGDIPAVSLKLVQSHFTHRDFRSAAQLWQAAATRRWMDETKEQSLDFRPIIVGDVTYETPVSVLKPM